MFSDEPHASWHPALRPNSEFDARQASTPVTDQPPPTARNAIDTGDVHDKGNGFDAWFPDYATGNATESTKSVTNRLSTISFTRTVPHEVDLNDDDDGDDDDPERTRPNDASKFMPSTERTNSFPPAPPLAQKAEPLPEHPLPASQAEDIMHEIERADLESSHDDFSVPAAGDRLGDDNGFSDHGGSERRSSPPHYAGGDLRGTAEEASEAQYAEEEPLLPHGQAQETTGHVAEHVDGRDPFAHHAGADVDDFAEQIQTAEETPAPTSMEGKQYLAEKTQFMVEEAPMAEDTGADQDDFFGRARTEAMAPEPMPALDAQPGLVEERNPFAKDTSADEDDFFRQARTGPSLEAQSSITEQDDFFHQASIGAVVSEPVPVVEAQSVEERNPFAEDTTEDDFFSRGPTEAMAPEPVPVLEVQSDLVQESIPFAQDTSADQDDFFHQVRTKTKEQSNALGGGTARTGEDLDAKWKEMFGDEDDDGFLPDVGDEKTVDPAAFFGDDDEGFLEDNEAPKEVTVPPTPTDALGVNGSYTPPTLARAKTVNPYLPTAPTAPTAPSTLPTSPYQASAPHQASTPYQSPALPPAYGFAAPPPPPRPEPAKAQSFITAKGGSGYDLDMDVLKSLKPKKRASMQSLPRPASSLAGAMAPPRSVSYAQAPPRPASVSGLTPPSSSHSTPTLPMVARPPMGAPRAASFNDTALAYRAGQQPLTPVLPPTDATSLVSPGRVNPYAPLPSAGPSPIAAAAQYTQAPQYSPNANAIANGTTAGARYSPALPASRPPNTNYTPAGHVPPSGLAHQPRTSSPLAHFETRSDRQRHAEPPPPLSERRSTSSLYDSRLQRVPSLPPTREVEEEDGLHMPMQPMAPPPLAGRSTISPRKRGVSQFSPRAASQEFMPPPRSQTQSPGALFGINRPTIETDMVPRPSSAHSPASPLAALDRRPSLTARARTHSHNLEYMTPTDGRENDPLQRWRGCPLISWGVGGTVVTMFPREVPRYGMNQTHPLLVRSPGQVQIKSVKEMAPLEDRVSRFPGPLKGKSKKKETVAWLTAGIEGLEAAISATDDKRTMERVLLWKILRVFIEHDGLLEGNPAVEGAVGAVLSPPGSRAVPGFTTAASFEGLARQPQSGAPDSTTMEQMQLHLSEGDREKAAWAAVDKRLWGHAMLIANSASPDLYKRVAQEFVRTEVNVPGHDKQSLAALYAVLSGNHDESVDELVPMHARAGLQLVAKDSASSGVSQDAMTGLDKWRETLGLVLSNRSTDDARAINSLGTLLAEYGRVEAAHVCFLFARSRTVFGGDPSAHFVLVGCDHRSQQFANEMEPILLSEVYEYGLSLTGPSALAPGCPHLAGYKLQHALTLAEYGQGDKALQYCEALVAGINAQTRRSPYHHAVLEAAVEDLARRLKLAPRDSGSWKSMTKVSDSMWSRFNKFVAGDERDNGSTSPEDELGPFARVAAAATPAISRTPSTTNFGGPVPGIPAYPPAPALHNNGMPPPPPPTRAASRYAPAVPQLVMSGNPYDAPHVPVAPQPPITPGNPFEATYAPPHVQGPDLSYDQPAPPAPAPSFGYGPPGYPSYPANGNAMYAPLAPDFGDDHASRPETNLTDLDRPSEVMSGYEAPSYQPYGYEPPSYAPVSTVDDDDKEDDQEDQVKPKKKGIMYGHDVDDDADLAPKPREKTKEEKDRENAEMVRRIAEEEAKRDAEAKATKKGWGFGWFGGGAKKDNTPEPNKPIRAKLGEANSFIYDPDLKRWVNKNASQEESAPKATPPPPRASIPRSTSATPPASSSAPPPMAGGPPPPRGVTPSADGNMPPPPSRTTSSGPPSRPGTSLSTTSSIDDLLAVGPKKPGAKKARKGGRYVDVMANN